MPYQSGSSAQRIRIGLTGLAAAFIIVLIASAVLRSSRDDTVNESVNVVQNAATNEPTEPLAELGVAPGSSESTNNSSSTNR